MAGNTSILSDSLSLYNFMCQHIVGTEETVRTKRLMNTVRDNLCSNEQHICITSGSVGEGLDLKGSDIDLMFISTLCCVHENTETVKFNPAKVNFVMEMDNTKPGYTLLRFVGTQLCGKLFLVCEYYDNSWYLSSELYKTFLLKTNKHSHKINGIIHGPCFSDKWGICDFALCYQNPNWIQPAESWVYRENKSWPSSDVKSNIIEHGVLLVPIGSKGSHKEALEWRISFSVAEKLLIYSFSHTQLLCYALMKILLKDLIDSNYYCKSLLCSYFIKTIIFWVSEETAVNEWKPENLIQCFMRCFRRLVYSVEYAICPHYFFPVFNMFENKIEGQSRQLLLGHLEKIFSLGWRCVFLSETFHSCQIHSSIILGTTEIKKTQLNHLLNSKVSPFFGQDA